MSMPENTPIRMKARVLNATARNSERYRLWRMRLPASRIFAFNVQRRPICTDKLEFSQK